MNKVFSSAHASSLICQMGRTERDNLITLDLWLRHEQRRIVTINHPPGQFMTVSAVQCSEKKHVNQWQAMKISARHQWKSMTISIDHSQNQWHAIQKAFSRKITKKFKRTTKKRQESITSKTKKNQEKPSKLLEHHPKNNTRRRLSRTGLSLKLPRPLGKVLAEAIEIVVQCHMIWAILGIGWCFGPHLRWDWRS